MEKKVKASLIGITSNIFLASIKVIVGLATNSASVLSEAINSITDIFSSGIIIFSVYESNKKPDAQFNYGYGQTESLSGLLESFLIFGAGVFIIYNAIEKFIHKDFLINQISFDIFVMGVSVILNSILTIYMFQMAENTDSIALRSKAIDFEMDLITSSGVLTSLIIVSFTHFYIFDPIISIFLGLIVLYTSCKLFMETLSRLLDVELPSNELLIIQKAIQECTNGIVEYNSLRTRKSGETRYIDFHIVLPGETSVINANKITQKIKDNISINLNNCNILIHEEPCKYDCFHCKLECSYPK